MNHFETRLTDEFFLGKTEKKEETRRLKMDGSLDHVKTDGFILGT
jgi:hypothetical protein